MAKTCFLIDDDVDDQEIFLLALQKLNADIICGTANDGVEGLEILEDHTYQPDFIFVDINMPKMKGIDCLEGIRKLDHLADTKVIMYSTSIDSTIAAQCKVAGANAVLTKPPSVRQLVESLKIVLNLKSTDERTK